MRDVICIGGANWDIKARASVRYVERSSNPGTVARTPGGVARNIAENLARLGLDVELIAAFGNDDEGEALIAHTAAARVCVTPCRVAGLKTGSYISIHDDSGELRAAINAMAIADQLSPAFLAGLPPLEARFILADCNLPLQTLAWLKSSAARLIVEPVSVAKAAKLVSLGLDGIFLTTPNAAQAEVLNTAPGKPENAVITLGGEGAIANGEPVPPVADAARVIDVTGAGDAATAGLIYGLCQGLDVVEAARLGQAAAAITAEDALSVSPLLTPRALLSRAAFAKPVP